MAEFSTCKNCGNSIYRYPQLREYWYHSRSERRPVCSIPEPGDPEEDLPLDTL